MSIVNGDDVAVSSNGSSGDWETQRKARWQELREEVEARGGLLTVDMKRLRKLDLSGRLGPFVVQSIARELKSVGLRHTKLGDQQFDQVRLVVADGPADKLLNAALHRGEAEDRVLRQALKGGREYKEFADQVRELIANLDNDA